MCLRPELLQVNMIPDCYLIVVAQVDETPNNEVQTSTVCKFCGIYGHKYLMFKASPKILQVVLKA
jgi:hypothetical protein